VFRRRLLRRWGFMSGLVIETHSCCSHHPEVHRFPIRCGQAGALTPGLGRGARRRGAECHSAKRPTNATIGRPSRPSSDGYPELFLAFVQVRLQRTETGHRVEHSLTGIGRLGQLRPRAIVRDHLVDQPTQLTVSDAGSSPRRLVLDEHGRVDRHDPPLISAEQGKGNQADPRAKGPHVVTVVTNEVLTVLQCLPRRGLANHPRSRQIGTSRPQPGASRAQPKSV
jgi:hypothetical protein